MRRDRIRRRRFATFRRAGKEFEENRARVFEDRGRLAGSDGVDEVDRFERRKGRRLDGEKRVVSTRRERSAEVDRFDVILLAQLVDERPRSLNFAPEIVVSPEDAGVGRDDTDPFFRRISDVH